MYSAVLSMVYSTVQRTIWRSLKRAGRNTAYGIEVYSLKRTVLGFTFIGAPFMSFRLQLRTIELSRI